MSWSEATLLVMAKAPVAGLVKTRLCPPLSAEEAAQAAEALLIDTLDAVLATPARRRLLALDGQPGSWLPAGFDVIGQSGDGLAERLAHAWAAVDGPGLQIGMDTPQVTPALLGGALEQLRSTDAVLGLADDGGWWAIGLREHDREVFRDVPMSAADTGMHQLRRLHQLGLEVELLPPAVDIDTWADLEAVAATIPGSRTAELWRRLAPALPSASAAVTPK